MGHSILTSKQSRCCRIQQQQAVSTVRHNVSCCQWHTGQQMVGQTPHQWAPQAPGTFLKEYFKFCKAYCGMGCMLRCLRLLACGVPEGEVLIIKA